MTRGTNFLKSSKCACGRIGTANRPFGHQTKSGRFYLKGRCGCQKIKSLPYTPQQLEMEGDRICKFFKRVYNKVLKPVGKKIIAKPGRAIQIGAQLGAAAASKNPKAIMNAGMQAGKFGITGNGMKGGKILTLTDNYGGQGLYLRQN